MTNKQTNKQTNEQTNKRTNEQTNKRTNEQTNKRTNEQTNNKLRPLVLALQAALATGIALPTTSTWAAETTRVSVSSAGVQGNGNFYGSYPSAISADGRYVAFSSNDSNLVAGDTNGWNDIFVRDRLTHQTTRVSVDSIGIQGNAYSYSPAVSANGRFVAFESSSTNLVADDINGRRDIFVRDRATNQTTRVSVSSAGTQGNGTSSRPTLSADGRFVAFRSSASNLVTGDTNSKFFHDIFVRDRSTNQTTRVSVDSAGGQGDGTCGYTLAISANGRFVAFESTSTNLVDDDTNGRSDIFVRDRATNQTTRVSMDSAGVQGNLNSSGPALSADGRFVAFYSSASNLVAGDTNANFDIFLRDRATNQTTRVSMDSAGVQGNLNSYGPALSTDGRFVAFYSSASNLVAGDTNANFDIFLRDRATNQTTRVSVNSAGVQGNLNSSSPALSADGRFVAFDSAASNLVTGDTNATRDIFVRDRLLTPAVTADIALTQTVSANPVTVGANFSYTATVKNNGPANAANVVLTGYAPLDGRVIVPPTLTPSQGACHRGLISICRLGTINAGQQATVQMTFTARVKGIVANRVTVSASPKDPTPFNSVTTSTTIVP